MGRGLSLTKEEEAKVRALDSIGLSKRAIALQVKRSRKAISNFLNKSPGQSRRKNAGRPRKLSEQAARAVIRKACASQMTLRELRDMYGLPVGVRRVQQILHETKYLESRRMKRAPSLTPWHKDQHNKLARVQLRLSPSQWSRTIFSDEKRFCLDGPDSFAYY